MRVSLSRQYFNNGNGKVMKVQFGLELSPFCAPAFISLMFTVLMMTSHKHNFLDQYRSNDTKLRELAT